MSIVVNKSNARAFLVLCAKLSAVESKKDREFLLLSALREGVFKQKLPKQSGENPGSGKLTTEEAAKFFSGECDPLIGFVTLLAEWLNRGTAFEIFERETTKIQSWKAGTKYSNEKYLDLKCRPDIGNSRNQNIDECKDVSEIINDQLFIPAFLAAMGEYSDKRKLVWSEIPLRICDWCHTPFFGNRYDQRFCSKIHGQRWHAEQSYKKGKRKRQSHF